MIYRIYPKIQNPICGLWKVVRAISHLAPKLCYGLPLAFQVNGYTPALAELIYRSSHCLVIRLGLRLCTKHKTESKPDVQLTIFRGMHASKLALMLCSGQAGSSVHTYTRSSCVRTFLRTNMQYKVVRKCAAP